MKQGLNLLVFVTVFALEGAEVRRGFGGGLNAVDLSGLNPASTEPCLVAASTVLLAEEHVHPAVAPLCGSPIIPVEKEEVFNVLLMYPLTDRELDTE